MFKMDKAKFFMNRLLLIGIVVENKGVLNSMAETEKITINIDVVDLGKIDLLVNQGFYSNRTDLIKTSIRKEMGAFKAKSDIKALFNS